MPETTFAERLRQAMSDAGLKQVDLVRIAAERQFKLGKSQVSQYLSGKTFPRPAQLAALADILEIEPNWLAGSPDADSSKSEGVGKTADSAAANAT